MELIFDIWRQVARNSRLEDSMPRISEAIATRFPVALVLLRRLDTEGSRMETSWASSHDGTITPPLLRTSLSEHDLDSIIEWFGRGGLLNSSRGRGEPIARAALPSGVEGEVLLGPLSSESGPLGVLALVATQGTVFTEEHRGLAKIMLEPLCTALMNDVTFHRLDRARLAIAADKDALLSRLQRQDISPSIVGSEAGLRPVMEQVERVSHTDAPVLILGETGTGKEVIARTIHQKSRRASGPMFRVNCGAIPTELVDSELFGHERGAFTGAVAGRKGWFERADGGTLFLDEVAELPPAAQVRLLRVLQDGAMERVGGQRTFTVDVRIVAATNASMEELISSGKFREDLWYRLSVFPIKLPPLRERVQDIPALTAHFAWGAGKRLGGAPLAPSARDVGVLVSYGWPGNVRELAAVVERAAILGDGKRLEIEAALGRTAGHVVVPANPSARVSIEGAEEFRSLDQAMADHIEAALERTMGRIEGRRGAAALLGINPHTLRARMRKLEIDWRRFRG